MAIAGTTILMAQDRGGEGYRRMGQGMMQGDRDGPRGGGDRWHRFGGALVMGREHPRLSADDMRAFADARIAALHAGLELRPDQEKNWPPFEQALRAAAKDRIDRIQARQAAGDGQQAQASDPVERLKRVADAMSKRGAALKQIADTASPLYQSLDDAQKNRFRILARFGRHHHMGWRHQHSDQ
ncbi:MAG: Spy/CpxP family protein refolding chaperone [Alphaproteobacteria bacterium]|nr:Spy/CpxP family protein refolding chaperone [Alphaproteobacteria bacterium]